VDGISSASTTTELLEENSHRVPSNTEIDQNRSTCDNKNLTCWYLEAVIAAGWIDLLIDELAVSCGSSCSAWRPARRRQGHHLAGFVRCERSGSGNVGARQNSTDERKNGSGDAGS